MAGHRADVRRACLARSRPGSSRDLGTAVPLDELCRLTKHRRCPSRPVDRMRPPGAMGPLHQFPGPIGSAPGLHSLAAQVTSMDWVMSYGCSRPVAWPAAVSGARRPDARSTRSSRSTGSRAPAVHRRPPMQRVHAVHGGDVPALLPPGGHPRRACRRGGPEIRLAGAFGLRRRLPSWGLAAPCPRRPRSAVCPERNVNQPVARQDRSVPHLHIPQADRFEHGGGQRWWRGAA
jgi:hypothetical protein